MNIRMGIKKWTAVALSLAMLLGIVSDVYRSMSSLAAGTAEEPSVKAYADTEQLMSFSPTDEGIVANQVGRIKLGSFWEKDVEWYILGKDTGVEGDNTAIYAASELSMSEFQENVTYNYDEDGMGELASNVIQVADSSEEYDEKYGSYDDKTIKPTEVYINHYGASTLRQNLQKLAKTDDGTFTQAELNLLQATTITTEDYKNKKDSEFSTYTTTDVLYAAGCDPNANIITGKTGCIYIGSTDSIKEVKIADLFNSKGWMWLRTPNSNGGDIAKYTYPGGANSLSGMAIDLELCVRPATNLNLKGVLFASSAKAANTDILAGALITEEEQPISDGDSGLSGGGDGDETTTETAKRLDAMTLRLRGSAETVGSVSYKDDTIKATAATSNAALVVQGRNSGTDWYYSKVISGTESIGTDTIKTAVGASVSGLSLEDIDLSKCKIWLETPAGDGSTLSYAVPLTEDQSGDHTHTFELKRNSTHHWYECTADDCTDENKAKYGEEEHTFENDICTVCGYDRNHQHNYV